MNQNGVLFEPIQAIMGYKHLGRSVCFENLTWRATCKMMERKLLWTREEVRSLLDNKRWRKVRAKHLRKEPFCVNCAKRGIQTEATDVDHKIPKRETRMELWYDENNLQSYCKHCHDTSKFEEENFGYSNDIGPDGFPIDKRHPVNKGREKVISLEKYKKVSHG